MKKPYHFILLYNLFVLIFTGFAQKLYVFYPTTVRPYVLQAKLSEACPKIEITVFGRYTDFKAKVTMDQPDALLTKPEVLKQFPEYQKSLSGTKNNKDDEPYILLSVDKGVDAAGLGGVTIGAIDFLGRKGMESLVASFFTSPPRIKRVTKMEDLLPLLTFNMVKAILICKDQKSYFKKKSQLRFVETPLRDVRVGIITLASKKESDQSSVQIINAVKKVSDDINSLFEVEKWK